jgi:hypothetical protein
MSLRDDELKWALDNLDANEVPPAVANWDARLLELLESPHAPTISLRPRRRLRRRRLLVAASLALAALAVFVASGAAAGLGIPDPLHLIWHRSSTPHPQRPVQPSLSPTSSSTPSSTPSSSLSPTVTTPETEAGALAKPSLEDAEAAVLAIATQMYPEAPWESAFVVGVGRDAGGTWWFQAWTRVTPEFEGQQGEQWIVTWDGATWGYVEHGTGTTRGDFPDVEWEDAP